MPRARTFETSLRTLVAVALLGLSACVAAAERPIARAFPEGDRLFHADPRWLGGDAAISVPLSADRTVWLFGDSFVDLTKPYTRAGAAFLHNTVAIETGNDPRVAQMRFHWRQGRRGTPAPFFPDAERTWYWPSGGIRVDDALVLFLHKIKPVKGGLGFASAGFAIATVSNPDREPAQWTVRIKDQPALPVNALPGSAAVREGEYVVVVATPQQGVHAGKLVRYRADALSKGDTSESEWWLGEAKGWVAASRVGKDVPATVMDDAGAECSLHWDERLRAFVHVASYGFGATVIGVRTAPALTGPWSEARTVYRPPESNTPRPFVYAGKAHPELTGAPGVLVTYVANSFDPKFLVSPEGERALYWPRFVAVPIEE